MKNRTEFVTLLECYLDPRQERDEPKYKRPAMPENRGSCKHLPPPQEQLDLHGLTAEEAQRGIRCCVGQCRRVGLSPLRIITGKGLHSEGEPVLPTVAHSTLEELRDAKEIKDFTWERKGRRRGGSIIVFIA